LAAPVAVRHTHVHSIRVAPGAEALVARVLLQDGTAGFGFSLDLDATVARDMAAWDGHAKAAGKPLWRMLGGTQGSVAVVRDDEPAVEPDWEKLHRAMRGRRYKLLRVDPFAWGSLEKVQSIAAAAAKLETPLALLAPNGHPWEIAWCAALAGDGGKVIVRGEAPAAFARPEAPGSGVDWASEPAFASIRWLAPS
jgi:L-alanine-DL-glutamate epimerase-like enolase superfamily enzyme